MKRIQLAAMTLSAMALGLSSACANAQESPGAHPAYLHALTDLRYARALLEQAENPRVQEDKRIAVQEISAAIDEIKHASIDDGKDFHDHPQIDANLGYTDRFHQAIDLLRKAREDAGREEDNPNLRGLQGRVVQHITEAIRASKDAVGDARN